MPESHLYIEEIDGPGWTHYPFEGPIYFNQFGADCTIAFHAGREIAVIGAGVRWYYVSADLESGALIAPDPPEKSTVTPCSVGCELDHRHITVGDSIIARRATNA